MRKRIVLSTTLLIMVLGILRPQFAQDIPTHSPTPDPDRHARALGLLRTIGTAEFAYKANYGSFASWQTLLSDPEQQRYFNSWLRRTNLQFGPMPELLPGRNLRANVHADGQGFDILLEDITAQDGYALLLTEHGAIRECKWLR